MKGLAFTVFLHFLCATRAFAQQQPEQSPVEMQGEASTIVVTARKTIESALKAPVAVTVFDSENIRRRQADSLEPLARAAPNVSYESGANIAGGGRTSTTFIRGIGQNDFLLTIDPGVGLYVDGVYVSRTVGGLLDTYDLASVQILRGPQGTFFGKNTIGGAILVDSIRPSSRPAMGVRLTLGSFDRTEIAGYLNAPLSSVTAMRIETSAEKQDGYVDRLFDSGEMGGTRSISGKASLLTKISPAIEVVLRADGLHARDQGAPGTMLAATNQIIVADPHAPPNFGFFYNLTQSNGNCGVPPRPPVPAIPACFGPHFVTSDPFTSWAGGANYSHLDQWGGSLTVDVDFGPIGLRSITAYRTLDSAFYLDTDASPLTVSETKNDYRHSQFSQELNASGSFAKAADWIAGLYYLREVGTDENELRFAIADFASGGSTANTTLAAFGHVKLAWNRNIEMSMGGRYSHERKSFTPDQFIRVDRTGGALFALSRLLIPATLNPDGRRILPPVTSRHEIDQFTPTVSLSYTPSEKANYYLSYSEGFKAGGFTQRVFPPEALTPEFGPEKVRNYEVGAKLDLPRRLGEISLAAFYADYSDMQLIINAGLAPKVENAGRARIMGSELELRLRPTHWLAVDAGMGYISATYQDVSAAAFPVGLTSKLPNAPKWTMSTSADAVVVQRSDFELRLHADWAYKSAHFKDANNSPQMRQPGIGLISANFALTHPQGGWDLVVGADNLTNAKFLVSGYSELAIQAAAYGVFGPPRRFYVRLEKRY